MIIALFMLMISCLLGSTTSSALPTDTTYSVAMYAAISLFRKVLLETKIYAIHLNLSIALLLTLITFVSGIETANDNKVRHIL